MKPCICTLALGCSLMFLQLADQKYSVTLQPVTLFTRAPVDFQFVAGTLCANKCTDRDNSNCKSCRTNTSPEGHTACVRIHRALHKLWLKHVCDTASSGCGHRNVCEPTTARFLDTQQPGFTKDNRSLADHFMPG